MDGLGTEFILLIMTGEERVRRMLNWGKISERTQTKAIDECFVSLVVTVARQQ